MNQQSSAPVNMLQPLFKFLTWFEVASLLAVLAGVGLILSGGGEELFMIAMCSLAGCYFLSAYRPPLAVPEDGPSGFAELLSQTIVPKVLWISASVGCIGILFSVLRFEGAQQMLLIAAMSLGSGIGLTAIFSLLGVRNINSLYTVLLRALPLLFVVLYFLITKY